MTRRRYNCLLLAAATILLGLASRHFSFLLPFWLAKNAGDVLYAVMAYWLAGFFFPRLSPARLALAAVGFCFAIEFLKFVQVPWLITARHSRFGALVFGSGFHASNLVCYALGVVIALGMETVLLSKRQSD